MITYVKEEMFSCVLVGSFVSLLRKLWENVKFWKVRPWDKEQTIKFCCDVFRLRSRIITMLFLLCLFAICEIFLLYCCLQYNMVPIVLLISIINTVN